MFSFWELCLLSSTCTRTEQNENSVCGDGMSGRLLVPRAPSYRSADGTRARRICSLTDGWPPTQDMPGGGQPRSPARISADLAICARLENQQKGAGQYYTETLLKHQVKNTAYGRVQHTRSASVARKQMLPFLQHMVVSRFH